MMDSLAKLTTGAGIPLKVTRAWRRRPPNPLPVSLTSTPGTAARGAQLLIEGWLRQLEKEDFLINPLSAVNLPQLALRK